MVYNLIITMLHKIEKKITILFLHGDRVNVLFLEACSSVNPFYVLNVKILRHSIHTTLCAVLDVQSDYTTRCSNVHLHSSTADLP